MFGILQFGIFPLAAIDGNEDILEYGSYWIEPCKDTSEWAEADKDINVVKECRNGS